MLRYIYSLVFVFIYMGNIFMLNIKLKELYGFLNDYMFRYEKMYMICKFNVFEIF